MPDFLVKQIFTVQTGKQSTTYKILKKNHLKPYSFMGPGKPLSNNIKKVKIEK